MKYMLFATADLVVFRMPAAVAQDNPYMDMAAKKYADEPLLFYEEYLRFNRLDTIEAQRVIGQIEEAARKTGNAEWRLHAGCLQLELNVKKQSLSGEKRYASEQVIGFWIKLIEKAKREKVQRMELEFRHLLITVICGFLATVYLFYRRIFKKMTGLSPNEFRNNIS
jgi:hypothetical protein